MNLFKAGLFSLFLISFSFNGNGQQISAKRGVAYGQNSASDLDVLSQGVSWWYNWYFQPETAVIESYTSYGFDYVPMAWNGDFKKEQMRTFLLSHPDVKYILGWNEPNFIAQANMKPSEAAAKWKDIEDLADEFDLQIVGPAVNWCGECVSENGVTYTDPVKYLDDFFAACVGCRVDHIAIHSYMSNVFALKSYVDMFKKYGKPIWLTEFASWEGSPTLAEQKSYMIGAVDLLENDTSVFRYAWFTGRHNGPPYIGILMNGQPAFTELGEIYVNMPLHDENHFTPVPARIEAEQYNSMNGILLESTSDTDGFANVGYIDPNDWLTYGIEVQNSGEYNFRVRMAGTVSSAMKIYLGDTLIKTITLPNTNGWQNWQTFTDKVEIPAGKHILKLKATSSGFNINWIELGNQIVLNADQNLDSKPCFYPNPFHNSAKVLSMVELKNILLVSPTGVVFLKPDTNDELDLSSLKAGLYLVKMESIDGRIFYEKVFKY
jgi:hypothetical protein